MVSAIGSDGGNRETVGVATGGSENVGSENVGSKSEGVSIWVSMAKSRTGFDLHRNFCFGAFLSLKFVKPIIIVFDLWEQERQRKKVAKI